jgi:dienelactone hydrolase
MRSFVVAGAAAALALFVAAPAVQAGGHSEQLVVGDTQGNHDLDCVVIRPWADDAGPDDRLYPVIGWANGWDQGDVVGEFTTLGYKPGLIEWALDGPYIVIAANQWSAREPDLVQCLEWLVDQNGLAGGEYEGRVDAGHIGIAGHSQGGGAVLKTGDGGMSDLELAGIIAMNPYGPDWPRLRDLIAPLFLLGGGADTTTPVSSYIEVWEAVTANDRGGIFAVLPDGTHNSEAWGVDEDGNTLDAAGAALFDFGRYQRPGELFWDFVLNGNRNAGRELKRTLDRDPWVTEYHFVEGFRP